MERVSTQEYLLKFGIRPSVQRVAIMEFLINNPIHPTAEQVYAEVKKLMPTISRMTVYNTLNTFVEAGAILSLGIDHSQTRYDADTSLHAHFMCRDCGTIFDIHIEDSDLIADDISHDFDIDDIQLLMKGRCKKCKNHKLIN